MEYPNPMHTYDDDFIDHRSYHEYDLILCFEKEFCLLVLKFEFRELNKILKNVETKNTDFFYCFYQPNGVMGQYKNPKPRAFFQVQLKIADLDRFGLGHQSKK